VVAPAADNRRGSKLLLKRVLKTFSGGTACRRLACWGWRKGIDPIQPLNLVF